MPGYNSFMGHDPQNEVTLIVWTSLTLSLDGRPTANALMVDILDQIYTVSPLQKAHQHPSGMFERRGLVAFPPK